MKLKTCEYCGTEYNQDLPQCPLCGKSFEAEEETSDRAPRTRKRGGARVAPKAAKKQKKQRNPDRIPQWMWVVICIILGLAVLIGFVYFLISMGYIGKKDVQTDVPAQTVVASDPIEEPETPEIAPVVDEEPVDLSCVALELSQTGIVFDVKGSSVFLTVLPTPVDCTDSIVFSSQDETVATVDQAGMITAVGRGQTDIYVTCGSVVESCTIVCDFPEEEKETDPDTEQETEQEPEDEEEPEEVLQPELNTEDFTLFRPGEEATISVKNAPDGANITYVSSDSAVATVSGTGLVKAVGNGVATITVTVNDTKLTCVARCNLGTTTENNGSDTTETVSGSLQLFNPLGNATDVTLSNIGESFTLSLVDANGNKASGVSWSTSNGGVCSVDANGRVSGLGSGTATVTATYKGQSYTCIVRCNF